MSHRGLFCRSVRQLCPAGVVIVRRNAAKTEFVHSFSRLFRFFIGPLTEFKFR